MARDNSFTFRINPNERRLIEQLSERLERTQSDSIRWSIRKVAREMGVEARDRVNENRRVNE